MVDLTDPSSLRQLTVRELRAVMKEMGIKGIYRRNKEELVKDLVDLKKVIGTEAKQERRWYEELDPKRVGVMTVQSSKGPLIPTLDEQRLRVCNSSVHSPGRCRYRLVHRDFRWGDFSKRSLARMSVVCLRKLAKSNGVTDSVYRCKKAVLIKNILRRQSNDVRVQKEVKSVLETQPLASPTRSPGRGLGKSRVKSN